MGDQRIELPDQRFPIGKIQKPLQSNVQNPEGQIGENGLSRKGNARKSRCEKYTEENFESLCGSFDPQVYVDYLKQKFTAVYGL